MKKIVSEILVVISFIGSIVTIYTDEKVRDIAKIITMFAISILMIIIIQMIWNYLTNWVRNFKEFMNLIRTIKEQFNSVARIDEVAENMVILNEKLVELDKTLAEMSQKNTEYNLAYNQISKKVKDFEEKIIEKLDGKSYFQYRTTDVTVELKRLIDRQIKIVNPSI